MFDNPFIYTDPYASALDEKRVQGPDTVIVPASFFHDSKNGQNQETRPAFHPSTVNPSIHKTRGQSRDLETTTEIRDSICPD